MKTNHAIAFFVLGFLLWKLPQVAPALCLTNGSDGSSTRALWLGLMGWVNGGIGAANLLAGLWAWCRPWLEFPAPADVALPLTVRHAVAVEN
jgi:hypothetical protein